MYGFIPNNAGQGNVCIAAPVDNLPGKMRFSNGLSNCLTVVILLSYLNRLHKPKRIVYTGGKR